MSFPVCTTIDLVKLRAIARGRSDICSTIDLTDFVKLAKESFQKNQVDQFISTSLELWAYLSKVRDEQLRLPPIYTGNNIQELVNAIFRTIFSLERLDSLGPGGNMVLNGIKGVGKTTLLQVSGAIIACLTDNIIPVYWIYELDSLRLGLETVSTYRLGHAAAQLFDRCENIDFSSVGSFADNLNKITYSAELSSPSIAKRKVVYLLDEFTDLYERGEEGIQVVSEYQAIGRQGNVFFLLAASKINVQKYIFPEHRRTAKMYPNLNCGLFEVKEVHPIRSIPDFIDYWKSRFNEDIDENQAIEYYKKTGGVGRYILSYQQRRIDPDPVQMAVFDTDPELFHIACALLKAPIANSFLSRYASPDKIDDWIDRLILYKGVDNVSFLLDIVKARFSKHLGMKKLLEEAHIFHMQRIGFDSGSSGHSNERFIYRYLPNLFSLKSDDQSLLLTVTNGKFTMATIDGSSIEMPSSIQRADIDPFLTKYSHWLMTWSVNGSETGLDRVWYEWDSDNFLMTLHAVQIKTGKEDQTITCGVISTERAKSKASVCNDRCIAVFTVKQSVD
eukprot:scaffold4275_cov179-Ochromonas_danica.AAC.4